MYILDTRRILLYKLGTCYTCVVDKNYAVTYIQPTYLHVIFSDKCVIICVRRWNYSEFSTCMSPCGIGIQTRDVTCIHEVTHGTSKAVLVPNYMCPQPPPADRRYCNVWDCPIKWSTGEWGKVHICTCCVKI